jgi:hypothetical protein
MFRCLVGALVIRVTFKIRPHKMTFSDLMPRLNSLANDCPDGHGSGAVRQFAAAGKQVLEASLS